MKGFSARSVCVQLGANPASPPRIKATFPARSWALALTLILVTGGVASANGQRRDAGPPAVTAASDPVAAAITEASTRFAIPRDWVAAVMQAESGGHADAVSLKGALGLTQVMPATWTDLRASLHLGGNAFDPHDNILAGAAYLRQMLDRYGTSGFLAAYNAGPGRYYDHLATGKPLPEETRAYMTRLATVLHLPQPGDGQTRALDPRLVLFVNGASPSSPAPSSPSDRRPDNTPDHGQTAPAFALAPQSGGMFVTAPSAPKEP